MVEVFGSIIAVAVAAAVEKEYIRKKKLKKRGEWSKDWYLKRADFCHTNLLRELRENSLISETSYDWIMKPMIIYWK